MLIGKYNKSVLVTYIGVLFSLLGIHVALNNNIRHAMVFLILAGICDLFDGKYANLHKRTKEEKAFGVQIDSLADMINFIAAPVVIALCFGLNQWYHLVIYSLYMLAGITRLGYFNIQANENLEARLEYYNGLPVTYSALIFPLVFINSYWLRLDLFQGLYTIAVLIVGLLFVTNIKIKKPRGLAYLFFICLAIALISFILIKGA